MVVLLWIVFWVGASIVGYAVIAGLWLGALAVLEWFLRREPDKAKRKLKIKLEEKFPLNELFMISLAWLPFGIFLLSRFFAKRRPRPPAAPLVVPIPIRSAPPPQ